ncbi:hypothetical protein EV193_101119 [Herbihabitans rhizosphaerae]|uniref:DUF2332 domain-containing protein n=1 Tax=Herbihabitans rhizosphaerae TaxID=1872711 RepID=A0A4Q7L4T3_9PSEU|nr:hypothetical protein EV193_101119 [Herbihabitans rhizosphaerae]
MSPLYFHLASHAAEDDEVAALLAAAPYAAHPTLLFAAVHRVLAGEPIHPLTEYYPTLAGSSGPDNGLWPTFRTFVLERAERIREIVATRHTQTNEVNRAALLYPAVAAAAKQAKAPVGLLEVGCSAGLLLDLDRYGYRYQTEDAGQVAAGPAKSAVGLHCALELAPGATMPALPKKLAVAAKVGLDRAPVDLDDEEEAAWLEACVWGDQPERLRLLLTAARARKSAPELVRGDAVDDLAGTAARIDDGVPLVVLTSNTLTYLSPERRADFVAALGKLAGDRPLWWVSHESYPAALEVVLPGRADLTPDVGAPAFGVLGLTAWRDGEPVARALAKTNLHGRRMEWLP